MQNVASGQRAPSPLTLPRFKGDLNLRSLQIKEVRPTCGKFAHFVARLFDDMPLRLSLYLKIQQRMVICLLATWKSIDFTKWPRCDSCFLLKKVKLISGKVSILYSCARTTANFLGNHPGEENAGYVRVSDWCLYSWHVHPVSYLLPTFVASCVFLRVSSRHVIVTVAVDHIKTTK